MTPLAVFKGSDGASTKALYAELETKGPAGVLALNLFRAKKNSDRAKVYRGGIPGKGSYRRLAYDRKNWAMSNLVSVLTQHAEALGVRWGWKDDPAQAYHRWVLYVDTPTGQVSFHTAGRLAGPDYAGTWDRAGDVIAIRICSWIEQLLQPESPGLIPNEEGRRVRL
jgi:hypothetical protein